MKKMENGKNRNQKKLKLKIRTEGPKTIKPIPKEMKMEKWKLKNEVIKSKLREIKN